MRAEVMTLGTPNPRQREFLACEKKYVAFVVPNTISVYFRHSSAVVVIILCSSVFVKHNAQRTVGRYCQILVKRVDDIRDVVVAVNINGFLFKFVRSGQTLLHLDKALVFVVSLAHLVAVGVLCHHHVLLRPAVCR